MIVCLGWGSLIWDQKNLPVKGQWHEDGASLPVEFVRQSINGRLTLVIDQSSQLMPVLWAELNVESLSEAAEALRIREGTACQNIGRWPDSEGFDFGKDVAAWSKGKGVDGVVWTALGPQFSGERGRRPSENESIDYLRGLSGEARALAQEYVQKAPRQIDTAYRRAIMAAFGWAFE